MNTKNPKQKCSNAAHPMIRDFINALRFNHFSLGIALITISSFRCFDQRFSIPWDAQDFWFPRLAWIGQSVRGGYWGDFLPYQFSGYPLGADLQAGIYSPIYLAFAVLFPTTTLNINLIYLTLVLLSYVFAYQIGKLLSLSDTACLMFGLLSVGNGFFIGHSEHLSYLASGLGFLILGYGYLAYIHNHPPLKLFACAFFGSWHLLTAGYPSLMLADIVFFALLLLITGLYCRERLAGLVLWAGAGISLGVLLSSPVLLHFYHVIRTSTRAQPLDVDFILKNAMPRQALLRLVAPWSTWKIPKTDISMDRFHLLALSPLFVLIGIPGFYNKYGKATFAIFFAVLLVMLILMLGDNSAIPLRRWLAESWPIFRFGRFPCSEFHFQALLFLAFLAALGCSVAETGLAHKSPKLKIMLLVLVSADFLLTMEKLNSFRITRSALGKSELTYRVDYSGNEQKWLDAPRLCRPGFRPEIRPSEGIDQPFSWWGYSPFVLAEYQQQRDELRDLLCREGRLFDAVTQQTLAYQLDHYTPSDVAFTISQPPSTEILAVWTETNDGFWELEINGKSEAFQTGEGGLRYFKIPPNTTDRVFVHMRYISPVRRIMGLISPKVL